MSAPRDFFSDLAASRNDEHLPVIKAALYDCFVGALKFHRAHPLNDCAGIDFYAEYPGGKMRRIDIKIRNVDYGAKRGAALDVALELSFGDGPGWALKPSLADAFLIVFKDTGRAVAFPSDLLWRAVERHKDEWMRCYRIHVTQTAAFDGGEPISSKVVFVPANVLQAAINNLRGGS